MSARTPSVRPDSWSISLHVRRSRSLPVPDSNESMYSTRGGATSSKPYVRYRSRSSRRSSSMRRASAGSTSARLSGSSQLPMNCLPDERQVMRGRRPNEKRLRGVSPLSRCGMFSSLRGIVHGSAASASRNCPPGKPSLITPAPRRPPPENGKAPWKSKGPCVALLPSSPYLAGTVTGARASPDGSFMNWKKLELGSTTSTSPGFENEAR